MLLPRHPRAGASAYLALPQRLPPLLMITPTSTHILPLVVLPQAATTHPRPRVRACSP